MSKTEYAWVIQKKDGKFCVDTFVWCEKLWNACMFEKLEDCNIAICQMQYECKPVKVEIRVVGE